MAGGNWANLSRFRTRNAPFVPPSILSNEPGITEEDFHGSGLTPENPIQEQHPDISDRERFELMYGSPETAKRALENKFGHGNVYHAGGHNFSVRHPGERWRVLDEDRATFADITDLLGDVTSMVGYYGGGTAGAAVGTAIGAAVPPLVPYTGTAGAILGSGAGGAAAEAAKQGVAKLFFGTPPTTGESTGEIGREALMGMAAEGIGRGIGYVARNAPRLLTSPQRTSTFLKEKFQALRSTVEPEVSPVTRAPITTRNAATRVARKELENIIKRESEQPFAAREEAYKAILEHFDESAMLVDSDFALNAAKAAIRTEREAVRAAGPAVEHQFPTPPKPTPAEPPSVEPLPPPKPQRGAGASKKTPARKRVSKGRPGGKMSTRGKEVVTRARESAMQRDVNLRTHAVMGEMSSYVNKLRGEMSRWVNGELTGGVKPPIVKKREAYDILTANIITGYKNAWEDIEKFRSLANSKYLDKQVADGIITRADADAAKKAFSETIFESPIPPEGKAYLEELQKFKELTGIDASASKMLREKGKPPAGPLPAPLPEPRPEPPPLRKPAGPAVKATGIKAAREILPTRSAVQQIAGQISPAEEAAKAFEMPPGWTTNVGAPTWQMMTLGFASPWVASHLVGIPYASVLGAFAWVVVAHIGGKVLEFTPKALAKMLGKVKNNAVRHGIIKALRAIRTGGPKAFRLATTTLIRSPAFREFLQQEPSALDDAFSPASAP